MNGQSQPLRSPPWWAVALLVVGALVAYANTFGVPFLFDDVPGIVENAALQRLWPLPGFGGEAGDGGLTVSGRPVFALSLALNRVLGGDAVWGYHAFNLLVHGLAGLVLFGLLRRTLPRCVVAEPRTLDALALATAFWWTVHPLQTESVTYIVQRAEAMCGLFYLLTLYAFARSLDAPQPRRWLGAAVTACALGMATKEVMVTAPVVVWFYDRTFGAGTFMEALRRRAGFYAALAATWVLLAYFILSTGGNRGGTVGLGVGVTPWAYALTQFEAMTRYLWLSVVPHPLVFEYGTFWVKHAADVLPWAVPVLALLAATVWALVRRPALGFAGACFFGILAPTSLTPGTIQMIVEHRMYLPLAAVLAALAVGLHAWLGRRSLWLLGAIGLGCLARTVDRNSDYRDELTLWRLTVAQRPHNPIALTNLGLAHFRAGETTAAIACYERALREDASRFDAHYNLAIALVRSGRPEAAVEHYRAAIRVRPAAAPAHNHLGLLLTELGRPTEAFPAFEAALRLQPDYADAHYNLGNACAQLDRMTEAVAHYEAAVRTRPRFTKALVNLGNALFQLGQIPAAAARYEAALQLDPANADALNNLGAVRMQTGRVAEALACFERALAARPGFADAQRNLTEARAQLQRGAALRN